MSSTEVHTHKSSMPKLFVSGAVLAGLLIALFFTFEFNLDGSPTDVDSQVAAAVASTSPFDDVALSARSAVVYDATHNRVLFARNESQQLPLASVTKVPLALTVAEVLADDDIITLSERALETEGGSGFTPGEQWRARDLIDFTLVESSNDGAVALAEAANALLLKAHPRADRKNPTLWRMNDVARSLGLEQTYFLNVTGLDESTTMAGSLGSAQDVARLFAYALRTNPAALAATAHDGQLIQLDTGGIYTAENTNVALGEIPGLIAGKTGFTDLAGGNLVVTFDASIAQPIVIVVLGSTKDGRFTDVKQLVHATRQALAQ